ncbi:hypothetical protein D3C80_1528830 [compost metagenome]
MHHRWQIAHLLREFFTDAADTAQQFTILLEIHHRDQPVTDLHPQRIFQLHVRPTGFHRLRIILRDRHFLHFGRLLIAPAQPPGQP